MNSYSLSSIIANALPLGFDAPDAAKAQRLCATVGHLWMMSEVIQSKLEPLPGFVGELNAIPPTAQEVPIGLTDPVYVNGKGKGILKASLDFMTDKRLPSTYDMDLAELVAFNATHSSVMTLSSEDDAKNVRQTNLGTPIAITGNLVVALTLGGVDVSAQMDSQIKFPVGVDANGIQYLVLGGAVVSAQQGVYEDPFAAALAYWSGSPYGKANAPIMVAPGTYQKRIA